MEDKTKRDGVNRRNSHAIGCVEIGLTIIVMIAVTLIFRPQIINILSQVI